MEHLSLKDHLISRGYHPEPLGSILSEEEGLAYFLLWNLSGQLVGYQQYLPNAPKAGHHPKDCRYYTYTTKIGGHSIPAIWGLHTFTLQTKRIFIVEGVFDAVKLHRAGECCLALLGNAGSKSIKSWLSTFPQEIIGVLDSDQKGSGMKSLCDKFIITPLPYKDLGEMSNEEVANLIREI